MMMMTECLYCLSVLLPSCSTFQASSNKLVHVLPYTPRRGQRPSCFCAISSQVTVASHPAMDWSTSALMNNSPLARRLPGQRTPPDPTLEQPNAADLTYGWHASDHDSGSGSQSENENYGDGFARAEGSTRQQEAAAAFRQRRRERRANRRASSLDSASSSEGSIVSFGSAIAEQADPLEKVPVDDKSSKSESQQGPSTSANHDPSASNHDSESFICRICFDGSGSQDEGGETLGKLIAPCRCRGTMKVSIESILEDYHVAKRLPLVCTSSLPDSMEGYIYEGFLFHGV
jgi:hypothetical protein